MSITASKRPHTNLSTDLYRKLYLVRASEKAIIRHYASDEMKTPMHMSMGQEAIAVGVCAALAAEDQKWTSYRSHAVFLATTGDTDGFFAELYGKATGTTSGKAGSMHLSDPARGHIASSAVVASTLGPAVGMAFANRQLGNGRVSCVFFGDGAVDEGAFWESLNIASAMSLPVLFVCEDNGLAVHTPSSARQGFSSIPEIVAPFHCSIISSDSTDVEEVMHLAQEALTSIRTSCRPSFLHLKCYRYLEHVGVNEDFQAGYRSRDEYERWLQKDCLKMQRARLISQGFSEAQVCTLEREVDEQIQRSIEAAQQAPFPDESELHKGVFLEKN